MTSCTVCGLPVPGFPDDDVCCADCERNFDGDPLRKPPKQHRQPLPWWTRERLPLARYADGQRALAFIQGPWTWSEDRGIEERGDAM